MRGLDQRRDEQGYVPGMRCERPLDVRVKIEQEQAVRADDAGDNAQGGRARVGPREGAGRGGGGVGRAGGAGLEAGEKSLGKGLVKGSGVKGCAGRGRERGDLA